MILTITLIANRRKIQIYKKILIDKIMYTLFKIIGFGYKVNAIILL